MKKKIQIQRTVSFGYFKNFKEPLGFFKNFKKLRIWLFDDCNYITKLGISQLWYSTWFPERVWSLVLTIGYSSSGSLLNQMTHHHQQQQGVCHTSALPFRFKSILRQKKNYRNSNISPCKNVIFKKSSSKRNQNPSRYYNSITNLKFQQHKPKYHLSKILI
jgi:hypothetical protein